MIEKEPDAPFLSCSVHLMREKKSSNPAAFCFIMLAEGFEVRSFLQLQNSPLIFAYLISENLARPGLPTTNNVAMTDRAAGGGNLWEN